MGLFMILTQGVIMVDYNTAISNLSGSSIDHLKKVTIDDLSIETYKDWAKSALKSEQVDRKAIQEIAYRVAKVNYEHLLKDKQALVFIPPRSFASFTPFFLDPKEMFTYRLFDEHKIEAILEKIQDKEQKDSFEDDQNDAPDQYVMHTLKELFTCLDGLNKVCQDISNSRSSCQKG